MRITTRDRKRTVCTGCLRDATAPECGYKPTHYWQAHNTAARRRQGIRESLSTVITYAIALATAGGTAYAAYWFVTTLNTIARKP